MNNLNEVSSVSLAALLRNIADVRGFLDTPNDRAVIKEAARRLNAPKTEYWYGCYGFTDDEEGIPQIYADLEHEAAFCNKPSSGVDGLGDPELCDTFPGSGPYHTESEALEAVLIWLENSGGEFAVVRKADGKFSDARYGSDNSPALYKYSDAVNLVARLNEAADGYEYFVCPAWHVDDLLKR